MGRGRSVGSGSSPATAASLALTHWSKHLADLESAARALEDRFGLTPRARLQLGVEFGAAHRSLASISQEFDADARPDPRLGDE